MASEELARKLQRRLAAEQATGEPAGPSPAGPSPAEGPPPATSTETLQETERAAAASDDTASSELNAKLTRRLDINDGIAAPKRSKVFNPYTEFKDFSRKQIKEMEAMFKRYIATRRRCSCYPDICYSPCVVLYCWRPEGRGS